MSRTRIFVSSTCYDLGAVRETIRIRLLSAGHEPMLSEYPSFPVAPDLNTVQNCKKVVRESSDVFVLVVGGQRGFLDPETSKSIVNVEYETALETGMPILVFVKKDVATFRKIWQKNPEANFAPDVNSPKVFGFLDRIYAQGHWVFQFERSTEITEVLLGQLSTLFCDLINKSRTGVLGTSKAFGTESAQARQLALDKPKYWEHLLTIELLRTKFAPLNRRFENLDKGRSFRPSRILNTIETTRWLQVKLHDLTNLTPCLQHIVCEELVASWGPLGAPGDPLVILGVANRLIENCEHLLAWEEEVRFTILPDQVSQIGETLRGTTKQIVAELNTLADRLEEPFGNRNPEGTYNIQLVFKEPENIAKLTAQIAELTVRVENDPLAWNDWFS